MRLKLRSGDRLEVWVDMATDRSCGESRSDWRCVATVSFRALGQAMIDLWRGKSEVDL